MRATFRILRQKMSAEMLLNWSKINKNNWQIETKGLSEFVVLYQVYANELTVRTNELNDEHAFFTPARFVDVSERSFEYFFNHQSQSLRQLESCDGFAEN